MKKKEKEKEEKEEKEEEEKKEKEEEGDCGMVGLKEKLKRNFCGEVISATTIQQAATKVNRRNKKRNRALRFLSGNYGIKYTLDSWI